MHMALRWNRSLRRLRWFSLQRPMLWSRVCRIVQRVCSWKRKSYGLQMSWSVDLYLELQWWNNYGKGDCILQYIHTLLHCFTIMLYLMWFPVLIPYPIIASRLPTTEDIPAVQLVALFFLPVSPRLCLRKGRKGRLSRMSKLSLGHQQGLNWATTRTPSKT